MAARNASTTAATNAGRLTRVRHSGLVGAVLAHVIEEPQSTKSWAQGARGERRAAVRLEKHLAGHPVKLLHDRRIPGRGKANLDHLAVGPGGITVIDSKTHRGEVRVERVGGLFTDRHSILKIGGRDQTKLIDGVERQLKLVAAALRSAGFADVDVRGALCFPDPDGLPIRQLSVRGIVIDGPSRSRSSPAAPARSAPIRSINSRTSSPPSSLKPDQRRPLPQMHPPRERASHHRHAAQHHDHAAAS